MMTTNRFLGFLALLFVTAAVGCAGTGGTPGWVNGQRPAEFPERQYVAAIGLG